MKKSISHYPVRVFQIANMTINFELQIRSCHHHQSSYISFWDRSLRLPIWFYHFSAYLGVRSPQIANLTISLSFSTCTNWQWYYMTNSCVRCVMYAEVFSSSSYLCCKWWHQCAVHNFLLWYNKLVLPCGYLKPCYKFICNLTAERHLKLYIMLINVPQIWF